MERIYIFIIACLAGIIATALTMLLGLHWSCMIGTIIFVVAIALTLDSYFKERREKDEMLLEEYTKQDKALSQFTQVLGMERTRARKIYNAGYKSIDDLKNVTVEELIQIDDINPTLAKRIMQRIDEL
jgi:ERCC4-type nuclease